MYKTITVPPPPPPLGTHRRAIKVDTIAINRDWVQTVA